MNQKEKAINNWTTLKSEKRLFNHHRITKIFAILNLILSSSVALSQNNPPLTSMPPLMIVAPQTAQNIPVQGKLLLDMPPLRRISGGNSKYVWTMNNLKEFNGLMNSVSKDLDLFFRNNPDFIADYFGGQAYNAWGSIKKTMNDYLGNGNAENNWELVKETLLWLIFKDREKPMPAEGVEKNLCESPRVCQSMQYLVANSLLENWDPAKSGLAFYPATKDEGAHSFMVALPAGVDPTAENVRLQGFIIDPFYSQSSKPSKFLILGSDQKYSNMVVDRKKITRSDLEFLFGKNPLDVENPTPTPPPPPNPAICITTPYQFDERGLVSGPNGNPISASDLVGLIIITLVKSNNVISRGNLNVLVVKCDWDKNGGSYVNAALQFIKGLRKEDGIKYCLATFNIPANTVMPDIYTRPDTLDLNYLPNGCNE